MAYNINFNPNYMAMAGTALNAGLSYIPNVNDSGYEGLNADIEKAIYGDSTQDPLIRMVNDLSGNSTKSVIKQLNQKNSLTANNNNDLLSKWNNLDFYNTYKVGNSAQEAVGSLLLGVPWLDHKDGKVQFSTDNLTAFGKGAANGAAFGPWGALAGGILGGVANLVSRMGRNNRINKINEAINNRNNYNLNNYNNVSSNVNKQSTYNMLSNYYAEGGDMNNKGDFSNGVTIIGNGGTHEENPMNGVPMGVAPDGTPNLVEQGEVKFNNYVFSKRLFATGGLLAAHNLPTTYADHSFADIAEKLSKESSERPNDPISKRGLMSAMTRLQQAQEQVRIEENRGGNKYAHGGKMGRKYDGTGSEPNLIQFYTPQEKLLRELSRNGVVPTYKPQKPYSMMTPLERKESLSLNLEVPPLVDKRTPDERWVDENIKPIQFNSSAITDDKGSDTDYSRQGRGLTWLRYAPAVGAGLGVITDLAGLTNKPDYTNADLIGKAIDNMSDVKYNPIGNYMTYKPLDRNYYINKLNAQAGATRRAIVNQSGGNRTTALAGLLAADYNAQSALGDLARQAEEYNFNQRKDVETFNRGTNQFNSELALRADIANRDNIKALIQARIAQANLREQIDARASAGRAANLTNLFDSLGEIGREEFSRNMIQTNPALYYSVDSSGRITYKNGYEDLSEAEKKVVRDAANRDKKKKSKGGYLTFKRR